MIDRIVIDPKICHGKPVIRGTRTPVTVVLSLLSGGETYEKVMAEYGISLDDVWACLAFASQELGRLTFQPTAA